MKNTYKTIISFLILSGFVLAGAGFAYADDVCRNADSAFSLMECAGQTALYNTSQENNDPAVFIGNIIATFLSILGLIAIGLILYAGYLWMTSQGDSEKLTRAKQLLTNAMIGLIIIVGAYAITYFFLYYATKGYLINTGFEE